jgi:hypothetical protein
MYGLKSVTLGRDATYLANRLGLVVEHDEGDDFLIGFSSTPSLRGEDCFKITVDIEVISQFLAIADLLCFPTRNSEMTRMVHWGLTGELVLTDESAFDDEEDGETEDETTESITSTEEEDSSEEQGIQDDVPRIRIPFVLTEEWIKIFLEEGEIIIFSKDKNFWEHVFTVAEQFEGAEVGSNSGTYHKPPYWSRSLVEQDEFSRSNPFYEYQLTVTGLDQVMIKVICYDCVGAEAATTTIIDGPLGLFEAISAVMDRHWGMLDSDDDDPDFETIDDEDDEGDIGAY